MPPDIVSRAFAEFEAQSASLPAVRSRLPQASRPRRTDARAPAAAAEPLDRQLVEAGNAERFARLHIGRVRHVSKWGTWLVWKGGRWQRDDGNVLVTQLAKDVGRMLLIEAGEEHDSARRNQLIAWAKASLSARGIRNLLELARPIGEIPVDHEALDADAWLFGVRNGTIDLRTGELRAAEPADLITKQSPILFDPNAVAPLWERALADWFPDEPTRRYVQRLAGAAMVGVQRDHIFVIHYGDGGNGKGTFVRALVVVFGPYALTPHISLIVQLKHAEHDTVKADLFGARLAVASETERKVSLAEASVKNLTGGDRIRCRRMHENPWEFEPSHSLWLLTNYLPKIAGRDRGVWRRIRVVPWTAHFERDREDRAFDEKLRAEAPGILAWAVRGCLEWQREGLIEPEAVVRATLAYRSGEDLFARFAADTGIAFQNGRTIGVSAIAQLLESWTKDEGVRHPNGSIGDWLKENGATQVRLRDESGKQYRAWLGVGLDVTAVTSPSSFFSVSQPIKENPAGLSHASQIDLQDRGEAWEPDESQLQAMEAAL